MPFVTAFLLGATVGSFLNVCIVRLPLGESPVLPSSHCLSCRRPIRWYDNIPCVSYFVLRGRCRDCGSAISRQYVLVEFLSGGLATLFYGWFGLSVEGWVYLALSLALVVVSAIDLKCQIIPDEIVLPGMGLGVLLSVLFPTLQGTDSRTAALALSLVGLLAGGCILYLAGSLAEWALKKEAMGGGDVKLLAMIGSVIGWKGVLWTIFASSLAGSLAGLYLRWARGEEKIPFGPYLSLGAFLYLFFGQMVMEWYARHMSF